MESLDGLQILVATFRYLKGLALAHNSDELEVLRERIIDEGLAG